MNITELYIITYYNKNGEEDYTIGTEFSISKNAIIVYDANKKQLVIKCDLSKVKVQHKLFIDNKEFSCDENYIFF